MNDDTFDHLFDDLPSVEAIQARSRNRPLGAPRKAHPQGLKTCARCKKDKPPIEFRGGQSYCTPCQNNYQREWKYGLTLEQYNQMLADQDGLCAICTSPMGPKPCVDHIHETKIVRGLLCYACNTALGKFQDSPKLLHRAILYLLKNGHTPEPI